LYCWVVLSAALMLPAGAGRYRRIASRDSVDSSYPAIMV